MRLWELVWCCPVTPYLHVYLCAAVLVHYRAAIMNQVRALCTSCCDAVLPAKWFEVSFDVLGCNGILVHDGIIDLCIVCRDDHVFSKLSLLCMTASQVHDLDGMLKYALQLAGQLEPEPLVRVATALHHTVGHAADEHLATLVPTRMPPDAGVMSNIMERVHVMQHRQ